VKAIEAFLRELRDGGVLVEDPPDIEMVTLIGAIARGNAT